MDNKLNSIGRLARWYDKKPVIRALLQLIPGWGTADTLLKHRADELKADQQSTIEKFLNLRLLMQAPAQKLITRAKERWNYPEVAYPVRTEINEPNRQASDSFRQIDTNELISLLMEGTNLIMVGEAGAGKTTILISLCENLLKEPDSPFPIFIDAATWGYSNKTLLEYIASLSAFADAGIHVEELSRLNEAGKLLIVVNGWNEISANAQTCAREKLQQYFAGSSTPRIIVTTRVANDSLEIPNVKKVIVRGFTWEEQQSFIRQSLPEEIAKTLLSLLLTNFKLRSVTKNPFVLNGVVSLHKHGLAIADNLFDLFESIVCSYETEGTRASALKDLPLRGCHQYYLRALAESMNRSALTLLQENEARRVLFEVSRNLVDQGLLSTPPEPSDVIEVLCNHHLLHRGENSTLRFVHQRFQELFGASFILSRLENACIDEQERKAFQSDILNCPFWEDSLELAVSKLTSSQIYEEQIETVLNLAMQVDLAYASNLVGLLGYSGHSSRAWLAIRSAIESIYHHATPEAREYALHCAVLTHSTDFAVLLWPFVESNDPQLRLNYQITNRLTIGQLGPGAIERMTNWPVERRIQSIFEFSSVPENLQFIEHLALTDSIAAVRAAAIGALENFYLASDMALDAWRKAPVDVKELGEALSTALDLWNENDDQLTSELLAVARQSTNNLVKRKVGLRLLASAEEIGLEMARKVIREEPYIPSNTDVVITFLRAQDPDFLKSIALECLTQGQKVEAWMRQELSSFSSGDRNELVLKTFDRLSTSENGNFETAIAEGASESFIEGLLDEGLSIVTSLSISRHIDETTRRRFRAIERLLVNVPASLFIQSTLHRAELSGYDECAWIVELLDKRASTDEFSQIDCAPWRPTVEELDALVEICFVKKDPQEISNCQLEAYLVSLASKTDPIRYFEQILEGIKRHALAFSAYDAAIQTWIHQRGRLPRPNNPPYERLFINSIRRCGFDAVPSLSVVVKGVVAFSKLPPLSILDDYDLLFAD